MSMLTTTSPELWMPADVRGRAAQLRKQLRKRLRAIAPEHANWRQFVDGALPAHVNEYLEAAGRSADRASVPGPLRAGTLGDQMTSGGRVSLRADGTVAIGDRTAGDELVAEIIRDAERSWDAYVTLQAVQQTRDELAQEATLAQEAARVERELMCPVCGDVPDRLIEGPTYAPRRGQRPVQSRRLIQDDPAAPVFRSCLACFQIAASQYEAIIGAAKTKSGKTRSQSVAAALREKVSR